MSKTLDYYADAYQRISYDEWKKHIESIKTYKELESFRKYIFLEEMYRAINPNMLLRIGIMIGEQRIKLKIRRMIK